MDKTPKPVSSSGNDHDRVPEETTMETVLSDLHALKKLYGLLQRLDETPRALLKKLLDNATRRALLKQANALTNTSDSVIPFSLGSASPKKMDQATSSSSSFLNNKEAEMEQILSDLQGLTRLYMLLHKGPVDENLDEASKNLLMKILEDATQEVVRRQAKMLSGSQVSPALERKLSTRSGCRILHADPCQRPLISPRPARGSRRSMSRELSLGPSSRLQGHATPRHVGTERSSSVCSSERLGSRLSTSMTSRHGMEHVGRGVATPECSSSSNTMATIQSRIRPSNNLHVKRFLRRPAEKGRASLKRHASDVSSPNMCSSSVSSGNKSSSSAASLSASTSPTPLPTPGVFIPYHHSPSVTAPRGIAQPVTAPKISRSMRRRHRQEILEKRVTRLRMLKDKIATVIHHRHDHHHHHHLGGGQDAGPSSRSVVRGAGHLNSPWQYITSMFHHAKGKANNITRRTVAAVPEKRRGGGGGGNMHTLFDAVWRHLKSKRRAPAGVKLKRKASLVRAKKMHWWQRLNRRRGVAGVTVGSRPRRRLGHGKAGWV